MTEAQSRAIKKYSEKEGLISKSYKLKREIVEAFAESVERCTIFGGSFKKRDCPVLQAVPPSSLFQFILYHRK